MRNLRNPILIALSLVVSLLLGGAAADRRVPEEQRRIPHHKVDTTPVRHETAFRAVPDGKQLQIRAIIYNGSTNGTLTVQVKNPTKTAQKFSAAGLYFVPDGNPETAPQRLGAVGPMQLATDATKELSELPIAAGETIEVQLDVFCIDSHRSSPSPQNKFSVGTKRLPKDLTSKIEKKANDAVDASRRDGHAAPRPAAKQRIQSDVWESRDSKWVELDGEGSQEAKKKR